jgi:hypothetical protein
MSGTKTQLKTESTNIFIKTRISDKKGSTLKICPLENGNYFTGMEK